MIFLGVDGTQYIGNGKDLKRTGYGRLKNPDGTWYIGNWDDD